MAGATVDIVTALYERGMHHVLHAIFNHLDPVSLKSVESTCLMWRHVLDMEGVWQMLFSKSMKQSSDWRSFNNVINSSNIIQFDANNNESSDSDKCVLIHQAVNMYENSWQNRECKIETLSLMKKEFKLSTMDHFEMNENYIIFLLRESNAVKVFNRWTLEPQCVFKMPSFDIGDTVRLGDTFIVSVEDEAYLIMDFKTRKSIRICEDSEDSGADEKGADETNDSWYSLDSTSGPSVTHLCAYRRFILSVVNIPDLRESKHQSLEGNQQHQHLILRKVGDSLDVSIVKRTIIPPEVSVLNMDLDDRHVAIVALVKQHHWIHVPAVEEPGNWELRVLSTLTLDTLYRVPNWPSLSVGIDHFANGLLVTIMAKSLWVWNVDGSVGVKIEDSSSIVSACVLSSKYIATTNSARKLKIWELGEGANFRGCKPTMFCCLDANLIPGFPRSHKQIAILGGDKYQMIFAARDVFKFSLYGDALSKFYRINFLPPSLQSKSPIVRALALPSDVASTRKRPSSRRNSAT